MTAHANHRSTLSKLFPFLDWFAGYGVNTLRQDLIAGITVAVVIIPQSMAYALLAGLPPVYGLYAAATAPVIGALWGSLRQLSTGPIAIMSLLVLTTLAPLAEPGSPRFVELSFLMATMVGVVYLLIGLLRMGVIMSFISHSAVKGFTSAAALIIISTQLPHLMGIKTEHTEYMFHKLVAIIQALPGFHWQTFVIGALAMGIIYGLRRLRPNFPAGLVALVVTTVLVVVLDLQAQGVAILGKSPSGLPSPQLPPLDFDVVSELIGPAIVLALVSFAETYSVGKSVSAETKQKLDVNQEFVGQGLANFLGSFMQCYPVSGSFSRTAINFATGAKTGISSVITSLSVVIALLFLTPLLTYIPKAALAALVIYAVWMLFNPREVFHLWQENRDDGIVAVSVFVLSLLAKPDYALLIGVTMSMMFFLWKTMHPRIIRISRDPDLGIFLNADPIDLPNCPQILILRSDSAIYFANAEYAVEHMMERFEEQQAPLKFLLLDLQAMAFIDITGVDELRTLREEIKTKGAELALMDIHRPVRKVMESSGFLGTLDSQLVVNKRGDAITELFGRIDHDYCKNVCPHALFNECHTVK